MSTMSDNQGLVSILLPERIDSETAKSVEKMLIDALRPGARMVVDGSAVSYMSAAGVRSFATVLHRAQEQQARIVFCRFSGVAADCLQVSGFSQLLEVAESIDEAVAKLDRMRTNPAVNRLHARYDAG
jgi:anti-sigma B factor antagonist